MWKTCKGQEMKSSGFKDAMKKCKKDKSGDEEQSKEDWKKNMAVRIS